MIYHIINKAFYIRSMYSNIIINRAEISFFGWKMIFHCYSWRKILPRSKIFWRIQLNEFSLNSCVYLQITVERPMTLQAYCHAFHKCPIFCSPVSRPELLRPQFSRIPGTCTVKARFLQFHEKILDHKFEIWSLCNISAKLLNCEYAFSVWIQS